MRYVVYSTVPTPGVDENENPITIPADTVLNAILWDGVTPYDPGPDMVLLRSDTLQVGDTVTP